MPDYLSSDAILVKPESFDTSKGYPERWDYHEADQCNDCGKIGLVRGEERCRDVDALAYAKPNGERVTVGEGLLSLAQEEFPACPACEGTLAFETSDDGVQIDCPNTACGWSRLYEASDVPPCDGWLHGEGPMMNYRYALPEFRGNHESAMDLVHLPLCLVEDEDGEWYLALTGGGMDLRWEICKAYMRLGYLPPYHFCDLPQMAGAHDRDVIAACHQTVAVLGRWVAGTAERLARHFPLTEEATA